MAAAPAAAGPQKDRIPLPLPQGQGTAASETTEQFCLCLNRTVCVLRTVPSLCLTLPQLCVCGSHRGMARSSTGCLWPPHAPATGAWLGLPQAACGRRMPLRHGAVPLSGSHHRTCSCCGVTVLFSGDAPRVGKPQPPLPWQEAVHHSMKSVCWGQRDLIVSLCLFCHLWPWHPRPYSLGLFGRFIVRC